METEDLIIGRVHHGRNIRRTRVEKNMNQEGLSELVHLSQPAVSKYEKMRVIDDEMLQRFARALNVPFDYLKTLEEDAQTVVFENNTVNDSEQNTGGAKINIGTVKSYTEDTDSSNDNRVNNFNPIDKITELYERLLKEKDEKYAALERRLQHIEESLQK
ncbi:helix-turn-helix domain-containing protein [Candidatus Bacteroides intestinigallinarum]|uniref:helix-turn-helix domain-containing protein n=1 Tax=Candidatus Bacteroides intestinigallinarum TaxID=2838470 RepID=UPI0021665C3E|nr:helix-turn-helix transcriptional regulator [Candidatus Bacteroides intestinigallinarum]MCS3198778.1 helix-turn-helix domain-containing protein [Candidatus Bacteroides intestinigallinarum]